MNHKRLNRDGWGFQNYPYYQMRIDDELFHGLACLIRLTAGKEDYWEMPKAGRIQVSGAGRRREHSERSVLRYCGNRQVVCADQADGRR